MGTSVLGIVVACIVGMVLLLVVISIASKVALAAIKGPLERRVAARLAEEDIVFRDLRANNFGIESKGRFQQRGNGALVLTKASLFFFQLVPESVHEVPLDALRDVTLVRSHLGKTVGYRLLKIRYATPQGDDSVAWYVIDPEEWQRRLTQNVSPTA
jgi:hypothetical protein